MRLYENVRKNLDIFKSFARRNKLLACHIAGGPMVVKIWLPKVISMVDFSVDLFSHDSGSMQIDTTVLSS